MDSSIDQSAGKSGAGWTRAVMGSARGLRGIPEVFAVEELDTDLAAAFGIKAAVNHAGFCAAAAVAAAEDDRAAFLDRMVADQAGAVAADGERPGFLFPGAAGIFAAEPDGDGRGHARAAAETLAELGGAVEKILEAAFEFAVFGMVFVDKLLRLVDAGGEENFKGVDRRGIERLVLKEIAARFELLDADGEEMADANRTGVELDGGSALARGDRAEAGLERAVNIGRRLYLSLHQCTPRAPRGAVCLVLRTFADSFGQFGNCAADEFQVAAAVLGQLVREFASRLRGFFLDVLESGGGNRSEG